MSEAALGSQELCGQQGDLAWGLCGWFAQSSQQDVLHPLDVDDLEGQGPDAGFLETARTVLLGQAYEFLGLAQLGPGKVSGEEFLGEPTDIAPEFLGLADHVVGIPAGIGAEFLGIVIVVGRAPPRRLRSMDLDQLTPEEDAHQRTISADGDLLAAIIKGNRVEGIDELDMLIGMNAARGPARSIEPFTAQRAQRRLLLFLEDRQWPAPGGAVDPGAGNFQTPAGCFALNVRGIDEVFTPEEAVPDVGYLSLDEWLSRWMVCSCWIDHEAAVLGVLGERSLEDRIIAVSLDDGGLKVIEDDPNADPVKELPGRLQAVDHILQPLAAGDVDIHMATEDQDHHQSPQQPSAMGPWIDNVAEAAEVDLSELSGLAWGAADRDPALAELAVLDREAVKRAVGNRDPPAFEKTMDLGELQTTLALRSRDPLPDLVPVRQQEPLGPSWSRILWSRPAALKHADCKGLIGLPPVRLPAQRHGSPLAVAYRFAAQTSSRRDPNLVLAPP